MFWGYFFQWLVHSKFPIPNGRYQKKKSLGDGGSNNFDYIRSETYKFYVEFVLYKINPKTNIF